MSEYDDKVDRFARKLWVQTRGDKKIPEGNGHIYSYSKGRGCDTCGFGGEAEIIIYLGSSQVAEFTFDQLDEVLRGILEA